MTPRIDWERQVGRRLRLRDLHVFATVARMGSMGKAAQELRVSQPAVSEVIADLEHAVGARLLDRTPQGTSVTLYGAALERRVLAVFDELKQGIKDIEFLLDPTAGEVRIGGRVLGGHAWQVEKDAPSIGDSSLRSPHTVLANL